MKWVRRLKLSADYPYMYARTSAKKAKLLDRQDYENLLKMQPNEIAKNLGEGEYKSEIEELGARYDGVELVELALNRNLSNTMTHLCDIAPEPLEEVIRTYLRRYDIMSVKRLLRWKKGGEKGIIEDLLAPAGSYSIQELEELAEKEFDDIIEQIEFGDSRVDYSTYLEDRESLSAVENALDRAYQEELSVLAEDIRSSILTDFLEEELEFENLRTALRLKRYGFEPAEIEKNLVNGRNSSLVEEVIAAEDIEEAMEIVIRSGRTGGVGEERLEDLEHALEVERLQDALKMLHTQPLGMTSILGYIVAKIIEVKNLRMLIRAKETGIQNRETIRRNLVMV